ncbi:MAG: hypothetical protein ACRDV4_08020 [Acidimicrobiales bacterium]
MGPLAGRWRRAVFGAALIAGPLSGAVLTAPGHREGHHFSAGHRHSAPSGRKNCFAAQVQPADRRRGSLVGCAHERRRRSSNAGGNGASRDLTRSPGGR